MPLIKREVYPVFLSRQLNTQGAEYELESCANKTLSNIVLQLSSLSKHAEDIFGELYNEADALCKRSCGLQERIDNLSDKVTKLDATKDDVSLQDIQLRKAFKSSQALDQEVVSAHTMPSAMRDTYMRIDKPPKLSILSQYREDGKEALKFYTDPKYFFELWCSEMQKNIHDIRQRRRKRRQNPQPVQSDHVRAPVGRADRYAHLVDHEGGNNLRDRIGTGIGNNPSQVSNHPRPEISHQTPLPESGDSNHNNHQEPRPVSSPPPPPHDEQHPGYPNGHVGRPARPAPQPPSTLHQQQQPVSDVPGDMGRMMTHEEYLQQLNSQSGPNDMPPPPPPPVDDFPPLAPSPPPQSNQIIPAPPPPPPPIDPGFGAPPPPPPPPPPPLTDGMPRPPPMGVDTNSMSPPDAQVKGQLPSPRPVSPPKPDPRSELLKAIERGINLKKTDAEKAKAQNTVQDNSVEAILSRRIAVELSDSEYSEGDTDDDWE